MPPFGALPMPCALSRYGCCSPWCLLSSMSSRSSQKQRRRSRTMASKLALRQYIPLPAHPAGDFDHGDVYLQSGRVFIANTAAGTVEVVDGERLRHLATIPGCPEASGVLCAQDEALIFAAARGAGRLVVIDPTASSVLRTIAVW